MSESLTILVRNWLGVEEQMKEYNARLKELREEKTMINDRIIEQMIEQDVDMCKLSAGDALVLKTQTKYSSVNKELIEDTLKGIFKSKRKPEDPDKMASETTEAIFNGREATDVQVLRKIKTNKK